MLDYRYRYYYNDRRRCLPACPAVLNEFARGAEFTDIAFDSAYGMAAGTISSSSATSSNAAAAAAHPVVGQHIVYVSTRAGTVMQVSSKRFL
jgi:hypothetical protein